MLEGALSPLPRIETGVPGLDAVLSGGLVAGATCLVVGALGTGKTTLGNQVAFHHARGGGNVLFMTVLAESHELMLRRLATFRFFDRELIGTRLHYLNLLDTLDADGLDGLLATVRREVRARHATLLVIDGILMIEALAASPIEFRRLVNRLQAATALVECTTLLLSGTDKGDLSPAAAEVDGILALAIESVGTRDLRTLQVVKFRGTEHRLGRHDISIDVAGLAVHPRLEALAGRERSEKQPASRLSTGISGLDRMLGGGLIRGTSTLLLGTPGSGKTITGLHFAAAGAAQGEPVMIATFHENADGLARTASTGHGFVQAMKDGLVEVLWKAPLEFSPDAWAWDLLDRVARHGSRRVFIDGISDIGLNLQPERMSAFLTALMNELRSRGVTTIGTVEIDAYVGSVLASPVPAISAMVDNGILLRHVEIRSHLHRIVSVLKARQSETDPAIREFMIRASGIEIGEPFVGVASLLTGAAVPEPVPAETEPASEPPRRRAWS